MTHEEVAAWEGFAVAWWRSGLLMATIPPQPYLTRARSWPHVVPTVV